MPITPAAAGHGFAEYVGCLRQDIHRIPDVAADLFSG